MTDYAQGAPDQLTPSSYVRLTAGHLWHDLPLIMLGGVLFILFCVPSLTLAFLGLYAPAAFLAILTVLPAWTALLPLQAAIVRGQSTGLLQMLRAMLRFAGRSIRLTLLLRIPLAAILLTWPALTAPRISVVVWIGLVADGLGILVWCALAVHAGPLLALYDVGAGVAIRNGLLLAARYVMNTVGMLAMAVLLAGLALYLHNALFILLPAVWSLFAVNNCRLVVALEEERTE